jgi:protein involved in polysaccharide export with SLBB domain
VRLAKAAAACVLLLFGAGVAHGQGPLIDLLGQSGAGRNVLAPSQNPPAPALSRPIDPAEYILGPGDVLQINLSGGVTRSWDATIMPEGTLYVPSAGSIALTGLTLVQGREAVLRRIANEYRGVAIDLRLLRPRTLLVYLIGETTQPGALEVSAARRASEVLNESVFTPNGSRRNVELRRKTAQGEERTRIDLLRFRLTGAIEHDPLLREGDQLVIPRGMGQTHVDGAVGRPGIYDLAPGDSLSTLLELAGGPLLSAVDRAVLVRFRDATNTDSLTFSVADVLAGRFDTPLRAGDHAYVYYQPRFHLLEQVSILGEVRRPGSYPLLPGFTRLSQLVDAAGGFLTTADLAALRVFRGSTLAGDDPELGRLTQLSRGEMTASEYEVLRARVAARRADMRVDWTRVKPRGDLDLTLRSGDIVRVDPVHASVRVEGEVKQPGLIRFEPGRRASDYIRLAGGFSDRASRGKVRVKRAVTDQTILARDAGALQPGDLVWVPERGDSSAWQNLQSVLLVATQVATIILAIRLL